MVTGIDGKLYRSDKATIWRWRDAYQNDFAVRMDWTINDYQHANHPASVVVNGVAGKDVLTVNAVVGQPVSLIADGSSDPDGNQLQFQWIAYPEAGYRVPLQPLPQATVSGADNQDATVTVDTPGVVHVILAVIDNGTPNLTSYRRVILNVTSPE
jgi:hypothetical protein